MSPLKKFLTHYSHFFTGNALGQLLGFISFPILTRVLSREEYGVAGLVMTTMFLAVAVAKAGLSDGIIRFYSGFSQDKEKLEIFASTIVVRGLLLATFTVVAYVAIFPLVRAPLHIDARYLVSFLIMAVYLFVRPLNAIVLNILRASGRTIFYSGMNLLTKLTAIIGSLLFLLYVFKTFYGYFIGLALSEVVTALILFTWFFRHYSVAPRMVSRELAFKMMAFGLPLLMTELSYLVLSYADRYMMIAYRGADDLGLYSVGYSLASYISDMLTFSLSYAVIPIYVELYEKEGRRSTEVFLGRCLHYALLACIPMVAGYVAISKDLFITLASDKYSQAALFSPVILLGALILGMNNILNAGLYLQKRSRAILLVMASAVVVNIGLNLFLIPTFGPMGAAWATLVACVAASTLTIVLSFKHIWIRLNVRTLSYHVLLSVAMYAAISHISFQAEWLSLAGKVGVGMLTVGAGVLLIEHELREKLQALLRSKAKLPTRGAD